MPHLAPLLAAFTLRGSEHVQAAGEPGRPGGAHGSLPSGDAPSLLLELQRIPEGCWVARTGSVPTPAAQTCLRGARGTRLPGPALPVAGHHLSTGASLLLGLPSEVDGLPPP